MAITMTSTSPAARPISRISFSPTSLASGPLFFGQQIQRAPAVLIRWDRLARVARGGHARIFQLAAFCRGGGTEH